MAVIEQNVVAGDTTGAGEPPADTGVQTGDQSNAPEGDSTPAGEEKSKVKLPSSVKPPSKVTGRFQGRISELVGQRDSAARERDALREQVSKMQGTGGETSKAKTGAVEGVPLNPEDFSTYAEYVTALANQVWEQKSEAEKSKQASAAYDAHRAERRMAFDVQAAPLIEAYGDGFMDAITDPTLPISEAMADAIMELDELGPYTMLYLASHRDEALKLAKMNPRAATIAIGKLSAKLDYELKHGEGAAVGGGAEGGAGQPAVAQVAPRPTPVPTPRGSGAPAGDANPSDKDSVEDWLKKETNRLRRINPNGRFYGAR